MVWHDKHTMPKMARRSKLNELQLFSALYIVSASVLHSYHNLRHISSPAAFITLESVGTCRGALQGPMPSLRSNISSNGARYLAAKQLDSFNGMYVDCGLKIATDFPDVMRMFIVNPRLFQVTFKHLGANFYASCHQSSPEKICTARSLRKAAAHLLVQSEVTLADDLTKKLQNISQEIISISHTCRQF